MKWVRFSSSCRDVRVWAVALIVAGLLVLGFYPLRELLAAEVLLALAFLFVAIFGLAFYFLAALAARGAEMSDAQARAFTHVVQRGYSDLEQTGRRWFHYVRASHAHK